MRGDYDDHYSEEDLQEGDYSSGIIALIIIIMVGAIFIASMVTLGYLFLMGIMEMSRGV